MKVKILTSTGLLFFLSILFFANYFNYFDPLNLCYISIDNYTSKPPRGNRNTIRKAIKLLKQSDQETYQVLCKYVDTIQEGGCSKPDENGQFDREPAPACYLRGSKTIFIWPDNSEYNSIVSKRAEMIKKYAYFSKNFWENRQD